MRGRGGGNVRPGTSQSNRGGQMSFYEPPGAVGRTRSKSVADGRQFTRDGRPIMHYGEFPLLLFLETDPVAVLPVKHDKLTETTARALYMYQAAIPEELTFSKGDVLAVLRHQDDGWWEATVQGGNGHTGLVPSNYLQAM